MTTTLNAIIRAGIEWKLDRQDDAGDTVNTVRAPDPIVLKPGTGSGRADLVFCDAVRTLAASATENLDLAGALSDPFGATLTDVKVKAIEITADPANTNDVLIGGAAANGFLGPFQDATDKIAVQPGGRVLLVAPNAGWTVTAGTGDILKVANSGAGTPVSYGVKIVGASA